MSLSISSLGANTSMMAQLQKMQQQMRTLSTATDGQNANVNGRIDNSPIFDQKVEDVKETSAVEQKDNVGAFANMLHEAFETVNNLQNDSSNKQTRFDLGDRSMTLSDVMLASQKASISFDATLQVRNKMIEAYKTISQMQI